MAASSFSKPVPISPFPLPFKHLCKVQPAAEPGSLNAGLPHCTPTAGPQPALLLPLPITRPLSQPHHSPKTVTFELKIRCMAKAAACSDQPGTVLHLIGNEQTLLQQAANPNSC